MPPDLWLPSRSLGRRTGGAKLSAVGMSDAAGEALRRRSTNTGDDVEIYGAQVLGPGQRPQ